MRDWKQQCVMKMGTNLIFGFPLIKFPAHVPRMLIRSRNKEEKQSEKINYLCTGDYAEIKSDQLGYLGKSADANPKARV